MPFPLESLEQMQGFFWVLVRVSIILFLLPIFGARGIPTMWKVGVSIVMAMILAPVVPMPRSFPETPPEMVLGIISEVLMGLLLAFGVRMLFAAFQTAGQFMAFQMGFAMARAMDPVTGTQSTVLSQFLYMFAVLIFFSIDGHHQFISALAASFHIVPLDSFSPNPALAQVLIKTSAQVFLVALKIAAPIMVALFLSHLCLGIVARTVPQMNILMIGLPVNLFIGLIFFGLILANVSPYLVDLFRGAAELFMAMLRLM